MSKNYKKDILSQIVDGGVYGAPQQNQTVKFQYATSIATAAASQTDGAITFAADGAGNAGIYIKGTLVSSKIQNVAAAVKTGAHHGGKTVTVTYIGAAGSIQTSTFDVIDEAALEAYLTGSKTISLDSNNIAEVKVDGATILVDSTNGLKSGLNIAYISESGTTGATIALRDNSNNVLSSIQVSDIVGDGVLKASIYNKNNNTLELRFGNGKEYDASDSSTYTAVTINLAELIDINDVFIGANSKDFLSATNDTSVLTLNTKMGAVTYTAATTGDNPQTANLAGAKGLMDAAQAIPEIKSYIDHANTDLAVTGAGDGTYINLEQDANNNKKLNASAFVNNLTYAAGTDDAAPATLTGVQGLVNGAQAATAISDFVNQRLVQKVQTLDASVDSTGTTYVAVGVAEVDGKITAVNVTETIGSITGSASDLTGVTGLIDGAATATAVKTYVDGQIASLDASIAAETTNHDVSVYLEEVDGKVTTVGVEHTVATVTFTPATGSDVAGLTGSGSFVMGSDIAAIKDYVDAKTGALDSSITESDSSAYVSATIAMKDGSLDATDSSISVQYTSLAAAPGAVTVSTHGLATGNDVKTAVEGALTWTILS